jgi:hypothetical protein
VRRPYDTVAAFETALKHKLTARVGSGRTYADLRKHVAFDRLLARLEAVAPDDWLLKGGVALEYRLGHARATKDVDLSAKLFDVERMAQTLSDAAEIELDDYFALRIVGRTKPADEVQTYRFAVDVLLENGKLFDELKVDVGFADPWLGDAEELEGPDLLRFAGIPAAKVRAIPVRQHLAEKLHAYTKQYGAHGSTRVKDLVDMVLLLHAEPVDVPVLRETLRTVFASRGTHSLPTNVPPPPPTWEVPYAKLAGELAVPRTAAEAHNTSRMHSG